VDEQNPEDLTKFYLDQQPTLWADLYDLRQNLRLRKNKKTRKKWLKEVKWLKDRAK
jgi:hypothetical protein